MADEELDEEMEEESIENEEENSEKESSNKIKLNFSMDPVERLEIEISASNDNLEVGIGKYLSEQLKCDSALARAYFERKITLSNVAKYVTECAKKHLNNKSGGIEDKIVFGWVLHYVQDENVKVPEAESVTLTKEDKESARARALKRYEEEELAKLRKAEEKAKAREEKKRQDAIEKEKKMHEESGQMSLFDF